MSTHLRTPRRLAVLAIGLAALLAAPAGPALAAPQAAAAPAAHGATAAPVVANPGSQVGFQWDSAHLQMTAAGGVKPYTWSASNLHLGTSINPSTGLISGVLRGSGTRTVTVTAKDATGASASVSFTWRVIRDACPRC